MKTIRSKIFPSGILSLVENEKGFWAVSRHSECPNCDWRPIQKLPRFHKAARHFFDKMGESWLNEYCLDEDESWDWITAVWRDKGL